MTQFASLAFALIETIVSGACVEAANKPCAVTPAPFMTGRYNKQLITTLELLYDSQRSHRPHVVSNTLATRMQGFYAQSRVGVCRASKARAAVT